MIPMTEWSAPYYGVMHLTKPEIRKPYQATVNEVGGYFVAKLIDRERFEAVEERTFDSINKAVAQCRLWISERNLWM